MSVRIVLFSGVSLHGLLLYRVVVNLKSVFIDFVENGPEYLLKILSECPFNSSVRLIQKSFSFFVNNLTGHLL